MLDQNGDFRGEMSAVEGGVEGVILWYQEMSQKRHINFSLNSTWSNALA